MMRLVLAVVVVVGATLAGSAGPAAWAADADFQAIAKRVVEKHIRPAYAGLDTEAGALRGALDKVCQTPSPVALGAAQQSFRKAVLAWSQVEHIRFGPVADQHRYERFAFWPDKRGIGTRQIAAVLADGDEGVTRPATLAEKSVALQGLTALEVLLFGDGYDALGRQSAAGAFRCRFAAAIGANLAEMASAINADWSSDSGFASTFLNAGPDNSVYRKPQEVMLELYKAFTMEIEIVKDIKLARTLGDKPEAARGRRAEFWRSGMALKSMAGNVEAVTGLFRIAFAQLVATHYRGLDLAVVGGLDRVSSKLRTMPAPLVETINNPDEWTELRRLVASLGATPSAGSRAIAQAAGLMGLNAIDGD